MTSPTQDLERRLSEALPAGAPTWDIAPPRQRLESRMRRNKRAEAVIAVAGVVALVAVTAGILITSAGAGPRRAQVPATQARGEAGELLTVPYAEFERTLTRSDIVAAGAPESGEDHLSPGSVFAMFVDGVLKLRLYPGDTYTHRPMITQSVSQRRDGTWVIGGSTMSSFKDFYLCRPDTSSRYRVTVSSRTVSFAPIEETCPNRRAVLAGTWQRS